MVNMAAVYMINYHFVWCPKYRKQILIGDIENELKNTIKTICLTKNWEILELEVMPDHVHLFISSHPYDSPMGIIKVIKGVTAKHLYSAFPYLKQQLKKGSIWSPSYYVGTAGNVSSETIKRYIQEQKT
jgi:putative transposase